MDELIKHLESIPGTADPEEIYPEVRQLIGKAGLFSPLLGGSYKAMHEKLIKLSSLPHGVGIGICLMAQINIAGRVLELENKLVQGNLSYLLLNIANGSATISLGVSESGWKGKLSNIKTTLTRSNPNEYLLNGEKGFFTNGYHSDFFIVIAKNEDKYSPVLISKNQEGVNIEKFSMDFAKEATHCRIKFENVKVTNDSVFQLNYSDYGLNLRLSEMLSLTAVFCGYAYGVLNKIKQNESFTQILRKEEEKRDDLLQIKTLIDLLRARVLEISEIKDTTENLEMQDYFPYGLEYVSDKFHESLVKIFPEELTAELLAEKKVFSLRDPLNELYIKRAAKITAGLKSA